MRQSYKKFQHMNGLSVSEKSQTFPMSFDNFDFISQQQERQYKSIDLSIFKAMQLLKLLKQVKNLYAFTIKISGTGRGRGRGCRAGRTEGRMRCLRMEHCKTWEQRFVPHVGARLRTIVYKFLMSFICSYYYNPHQVYQRMQQKNETEQ